MDIFVHIGYSLYVIGFGVKDKLWLRLIIVVATLCFIAYYFTTTEIQWAAFWWSILFLAINISRIVPLYRERREVQLSPEEQELYETIFRTLYPAQYLYLLQNAQWHDALSGEVIVQQGENLDCLRLIYKGQADVTVDGVVVGHLHDGSFIGEMSYISAKTASATIIATHHIRYLEWSTKNLKTLMTSNPNMQFALQAILNADLVKKLLKVDIEVAHPDIPLGNAIHPALRG